MANVTFYKRVIFSILLCCFVFPCFSNEKGKIKEFSNEFSTYVDQLNAFIRSSNNAEQNFDIKLFTRESSSFTPDVQQKLIKVSNTMLAKRLRPYPHFTNFLSSFLLVENHKNKDEMLHDWLYVIDQIITNSTSKKLLLFCGFTDKLINDKVLRSSNTVNWSFDIDNFRFLYDNNNAILSLEQPFNLVCSSKGHSYIISQTSGRFLIFSNKWLGNGGTVDWKNQSLNVDSVYAVLNNYSLDMRITNLNADSVVFYNKYLFDYPIVGQYINKITGSKQDQHFPEFVSYSKDIILKEIFYNVDYKGGYKLKGNEFVADGGENAKARIIFNKDGRRLFVANTNSFIINSEKIVSQGAAVKIFFDKDSIFHSNLQFKYIDSKRQLQLYRNKNGLSGSPMLNTYHNITMDFELLEWDIDNDIIKFGSLPGTAESRVVLESVNMYKQEKFESIKGIDAIHPLFLIRNYVKNRENINVDLVDFSRYAGFPKDQIKRYLISLSDEGFIFYNFNSDSFNVLPKLYNYILAASDKGDYDVISFNSVIENGEYNTGDRYLVNAALNIVTKDLNVLGIKKIELSKVREVFLYPSDGIIVLKKNRDFVFNGQIYTGRGRFNLFGRDFRFNYDNFKLDLSYIDSVQLSVPLTPVKKDMYGNELLTTVKTVIEAVKGDLTIDHFNNKSGIRKDSFPQFPIFRSFEDSYAYYDKESIFNGIYDRTKFSFHLEPFEIDSLDSYTGKGLWFAGTFESAGIFPNFKDTLRIQDDYSLGFSRDAPSTGFNIYGDKGKYYNNINLSDKGLKGDGILEYLVSKSKSKEIFFFPDSANLHTYSFKVDKVIEGIEFPDIKNTDTYVHFQPYNDRLNIYKTNEQFQFYNSQSLFDGDLLLRPTGITGSGEMAFNNAKISSTYFTYNAQWFDSDTTTLEVLEESGKIAFNASNLKSHIDVSMQEGVFLSNGEDSFVEFPANKYISYIDKLKWLMNDKKLILGEEISSNAGSEFISIHPDQDSLSFIAKTASYSLDDYIINARGVEYLTIADAVIYPDSGVVTVVKDAVIETLYDAKIVVDDLTEYHTFNNSTVDIKSAHLYSASGDYNYINHLDEKQNVFFNDIIVNDDSITIASAEIPDNLNFKLNDNFKFKGKINLFSYQKDLVFNGYFLTNHNCKHINKEWVQFTSKINPKDIRFVLDSIVYNDNQDLLSTGIAMSFDSLNFYNTFLSRKKRPALDYSIISANKSLYYDNENSSYVVGGPDTLSNFYILNDRTCNVISEGKINLNLDLGQVNFSSVGEVSYTNSNSSIDITGFMIFDFFFSEKAMKIMAEDLYSAPGDEFFEYDNKFANNLGRIVGRERRDIYLVDLEMTDEYSKFPIEMKNSIVFAKTTLKWDRENNAYFAKGPIAVSNILDKQVNATVDGYIIIEKGRKSDIMKIYLQTELYDEYYFHYENGIMRAWSTNPEFNIAIDDVKESKRSTDKVKGVSAYKYMSASEGVTEKFLKSIKNKY